MRYVAWEARLSTPDKDGVTTRDHFVDAARHSPFARKMLAGPRFPERLRYLYDWARALRRGLTRNADGRREITWPAFLAWRDLADVAPDPHEVDALVDVVDVMVGDPASCPQALRWEPT